MDAYRLADWSGFATAEVGAAAALTGLLFVAVSINLERILTFPKLPARAAETVVVLLLALITSSLALLPQNVRLLGAELAALALVVGAITLTVQLRHGPDNPDDPWHWFASRVGATLLPALGYLIAGITCLARYGGGLYWLAPATLLAFVGAVYNAWILLVEIIRQQPDTEPSPQSETP
jgi:modulator of FtsH protease